MDDKTLRDAFSLLPPLEPKTRWDTHRLSLRQHIKQEKNLKRFLRWSTIQATMFVGSAPYIKLELADLLDNDNPQRDMWKDAIAESGFGGAYPLKNHRWTSGNLVHQAFHLKQFMDVSLEDDLSNFEWVVEFGSGYGAMVLLARRLGFEGMYTAVDLPEFSLLQRYYLSNVGLDDKVEFLCSDWLQDEKPLVNQKVDLVIACYSLSESDRETRDHFLSICPARNYLFVFQEKWDEVNNLAYFAQFVRENANKRWRLYRHPYFSTHWYAIGTDG